MTKTTNSQKARSLLTVPLEWESGFKYRVKAVKEPGDPTPYLGARIFTGILGEQFVLHDPIRKEEVWATLEKDGVLTIFAGTCWDGPSGPAFDTDNFMLPSLPHDMLYWAIELGYLAMKFRKGADLMMLHLCEETGMSWIRRTIDYLGVRIGGRVRMWRRKRASRMLAHG